MLYIVSTGIVRSDGRLTLEVDGNSDKLDKSLLQCYILLGIKGIMCFLFVNSSYKYILTLLNVIGVDDL